MLVRGRSLWKNGNAASFVPFSDSSSISYLVTREQVTPAAAERQERSDRVSEEASYLLYRIILLTPLLHFFPAT
jgi:hypothetical protein